MKPHLAAACLFAVLTSSLPGGEARVVRLDVRERIAPGAHDAVITVYGEREGGSPLWSAPVRVNAEMNGRVNVPLDALTRSGRSVDGGWLAVRILPGSETRRVRLDASKLPVAATVVPGAAISANGFIESVADGFRFPDGSVQTSAATVSGGVPSVNGIGSAVNIIGAGTASVSTGGNTITVTGTGLAGIAAGSGLTGGGTSGTPTMSVSFGSPVAISTSNSAGVATSVSRSDHTHAHGDLPGGSLHAEATAAAAGFMPASDKSKLDAITFNYVATIIVNPVPGDAAASGTALLDAIDGISGNSATTPYLLKIEPGVYDIGSNAFTMKDYVDVEGSGRSVTTIIASRTGAAVSGAGHAEIRNLSISNSPSSGYGYGINFNSASGTLRVHDVAINVIAPSSAYGLYVSGATGLTVSSVDISATAGGSGYGIYANFANSTDSLVLQDSSALVSGYAYSYGLDLGYGFATIRDSTLKTEGNGLRYAAYVHSFGATIEAFHSRLLVGGSGASVTQSSSSTARVAFSQLDGTTSGVVTCFQNFTATFAAKTCP